jgi:LmbE family N-acetylglucosaminyl deacetylase
MRSVGGMLVGLALLAAAAGGEGRGSAAGGPSGLDLVDVDMMFVGAHPDDDGGILATFARYILDQGFRGTVVTLTGGEGGGNATGREAGRALGLIRSEEERRALATVGVDAPHFLGFEDFYFTLSAEETARKWGADFVCDVVREVRLKRPEVIITMWPGPGTHGEHQMAARAATLAFDKAPDPSYCPDQIEREHLTPFAPMKLYYYGASAGDVQALSVPTDDFSRSAAMRYADLKGLALSHYRSQGFDQFLQVPVKEARPETFRLVRSRVPTRSPESHLLEGALLPAGTSPPGVRLEVVPRSYQAGIGSDDPVSVTFVNGTSEAFSHVRLGLEAPEGWSSAAAGAVELDAVEPGARVEATFAVRPSEGAHLDANTRLVGTYTGEHAGAAAAGANHTWVEAVAPLQVAFRPTYDVAGYRSFARETGTEWVIESLPTRLPLPIGRTGAVDVDLTNRGAARASGELAFELPHGVRSAGAARYEVASRGEGTVRARLEVDPGVLPPGRHSARVPVRVSAAVGGLVSADNAELYALPTLAIPRVGSPPAIDGDLDDMRGLASGAISPQDLWWRKPPSGPADESAQFYLGYDEGFLYVGVHVLDDVVACNIAPDDVRAQLRSDAVGITVDPSGRSRDTSTTFQAAAFPCTTAGFGARGFRDADARPGLMEQTAPGMRVASRKTDQGYDLEAALPWAAMPGRPGPGDEIGLNVVLYDGDVADARVGANISESGLAWAAFEWGGKQALPYLWPRVTLSR